TLTARPGLPATILTRGLLTFTFFGADAYVTLAVTAIRHRSPAFAGIAVTGATVSWTTGAWVQARLNDKWEGRRLVRTGLVIVLAGIGGRGPWPRAAPPARAGRGAGGVDRGGPRHGAGLRADLADDAAEGTTGPGGAVLGVAEPGRRARYRDRHRCGGRGGGGRCGQPPEPGHHGGVRRRGGGRG